MIAGLNLELITAGALQFSTPSQNVTLKIYTGQTNVKGRTKSSYDLIETTAMIQNITEKQLELLDATMLKRNIVNMYIATNITSFSRAIEHATDYVVWGGVLYEIIKVAENFNSGWVKCMCAEVAQ